jgi:hypothetical protein
VVLDSPDLFHVDGISLHPLAHTVGSAKEPLAKVRVLRWTVTY